MNSKALYVFKKLMNRGYIERDNDEIVFAYASDDEVAEELECMQRELDFKLVKTGSRIYLIPERSNEIFSQDNMDFRKTIGSDAKLDDIYLLNYLAIYLLFSFYRGSGNSPLSRNFYRVSDFMEDFTKHCEQIKAESENFESAVQNYSIDFIHIADSWLAKTGELSNSFDTKYGCCKKIIRKFQSEELFTELNDRLEPTRKLNDLMPYFLSQQRITEINAILRGGSENAGN